VVGQRVCRASERKVQFSGSPHGHLAFIHLQFLAIRSSRKRLPQWLWTYITKPARFAVDR